MTETINQIRELRRLALPELRKRYKKVFGEEPPPTRGKGWLWKRLAWRLQADAAERPIERGHLQAKLKTPAPAMPTRRKPDLPAPGDGHHPPLAGARPRTPRPRGRRSSSTESSTGHCPLQRRQ